MHVVIVGCGRVGSGLARVLHESGHSVAVVDRRPQAFRKLEDLPVERVVGVGFDRDRLREAGIERADAFAAVTNGDNSNIVSARVARESFQVERVVARIYDPRRAAIYERLGIPTVATVEWTIQRVLRRVLPTEGGVEWTDTSAQVHMVERALPHTLAGKKLAEIEEPGRVRLAAVTRLGESHVATPDLVGQDGDMLHLVVAADAVDALDARLYPAGSERPSGAGEAGGAS